MKKEYRNVIKTKKQIRSAFVELLSEKQDIMNVTVSQLADRANIAKSTFYNHYDDLYAVVEEFENELIGELSGILDEIEQKQVKEYDEYIRIVINFLKENEDTYRIAIKFLDGRIFVEKLKNILYVKVFEESRVLPFSTERDFRLVEIRFITNACIDTFADCLSGTLDVSLEKVGNTVIEMLKRLK